MKNKIVCIVIFLVFASSNFCLGGNGYAQKAHELFNGGLYNDALIYYNKAVESDLNDKYSLYNRGLCYDRMNDSNAAIEDLTMALQLDPQFIEALVTRGIIYSDLNLKLKALNDFTAAHNIDSGDLEVANWLAWFYATSENKKYRNGKEAVRLADGVVLVKLIQKSDTLGASLDTLAAAYVEAGQYEKACRVYLKALSYEPSFVKHYQEVLQMKGDFSGDVDGIYSDELQDAIKNCVYRGEYVG